MSDPITAETPKLRLIPKSVIPGAGQLKLIPKTPVPLIQQQPTAYLDEPAGLPEGWNREEEDPNPLRTRQLSRQVAQAPKEPVKLDPQTGTAGAKDVFQPGKVGQMEAGVASNPFVAAAAKGVAATARLLGNEDYATMLENKVNSAEFLPSKGFLDETIRSTYRMLPDLPIMAALDDPSLAAAGPATRSTMLGAKLAASHQIANVLSGKDVKLEDIPETALAFGATGFIPHVPGKLGMIANPALQAAGLDVVSAAEKGKLPGKSELARYPVDVLTFGLINAMYSAEPAVRAGAKALADKLPFESRGAMFLDSLAQGDKVADPLGERANYRIRKVNPETGEVILGPDGQPVMETVQGSDLWSQMHGDLTDLGMHPKEAAKTLDRISKLLTLGRTRLAQQMYAAARVAAYTKSNPDISEPGQSPTPDTEARPSAVTTRNQIGPAQESTEEPDLEEGQVDEAIKTTTKPQPLVEKTTDVVPQVVTPETKPLVEKPTLVSAAVKKDDGTIVTGPNHPKIDESLGKPETEREERNTPEYGFTTDTGEPVTREEATEIGKESGQVDPNLPVGHPLHSDQVASVTEPGKTIAETGQAVKPVQKPRTFRQKYSPDKFGDDPLISLIRDSGGLMSKSTARSRGKLEKNASLWDDVPTLAHPSHNKLYRSEGGLMPDEMAQIAHNAGLLREADASSLWAAIDKASKGARRDIQSEKQFEAQAQVADQQMEDFNKDVLSEGKGSPTPASGLNVGDVVNVQTPEGKTEKIKVSAVDADTHEVTLEDGKKYGVQVVNDNDILYTESVDKPLSLESPTEEQLNTEKADQSRKEELEAGLHKPLTGTAGDMSGDMFDQTKADNPLFAPPPPKSVVPANNPIRDLIESKEGPGKKSSLIRKMAGEHGITNKQMQERVEAELVRMADEIVKKHEPREAFDKLRELYEKQPRLMARTSTSVANQAYSTPMPLAFLSGWMIDTKNGSTYEPTAGNGMLVIGTDKNEITANELDPTRAETLKSLGIKNVTTEDATKFVPSGKFDNIITNPPFGALPVVNYEGYKINRLEHLIALKALQPMKDDGAATLILGAAMEPGKIGSGADTIFFNYLYGHYNVLDNFEVSGDLYNAQGAAWPVRVVVLAGRKANPEVAKLSPTKVDRLDNWEDIYKRAEGVKDAVAKWRETLPTREQSQVSDRPESKPETTGQSGRLPVEPVGVTQPTGVTSRPGGTKSGAKPVVGQPPGGVLHPAPEQGLARPDVQPGTSVQPDSGGQSPAPVETGSEGIAGIQSGSELAGGSPGTGKKPLARIVRKPVAGVVATEHQVPYETRSEGGEPFGTLIPNNIAHGVHDALDALREKVGNLDEYLADKLNLSVDEIRKGLAAEQIDGASLAIHQIENGGALIIGDQTGIGKGRQAAAVIRYGLLNGKIPMFFTQDPKLFTDMYGDLQDIGTSIKPLILGDPAKASIVDAQGNVLHRAPGKAGQDKAMTRILAEGLKEAGYDTIFATYSQVNDRNDRQKFLERLASENDAIVILDEAHNAAGDSDTSMQAAFITGGTVKRGSGANIQRITVPGLLKQGGTELGRGGVTYLSATYAKRPDNMPVYFRTDLRKAAQDFGQIVQAMKTGGVALQQAVSEALAKSGQYLRRERDFNGVTYSMLPVKVVDPVKLVTDVDETTGVLQEIKNFSKLIRAIMLDSEGPKSTARTETQMAMTDFASVVHNQISQLLLAAKADAVVEQAIETHKMGQKPVIALMNTMESFLDQYVTDKNIQPDQPFTLRWNELLEYALSRTLRVTEKDAQGNSTISYVNPDEIGIGEEYRRVQDMARDIEVSFPVSPIDYILQKLDVAGVKMAELTGRTSGIKYTNFDTGEGVYVRFKKANKNAIVNGFNGGTFDGMLLNASGSTGLSAHAALKFKDHRPRHMIIAQPALDINTFVQTLGRIFRTGMIPGGARYSHLVLPLQAELRPAAIASRKMKSLNANTTAESEGAVKIDSVDFINKYGDHIVAEYLDANPDLQDRLDLDVSTNTDGSLAYDQDLARKFTGRMALLSDDDQKQAYQHIIPAYNELIEQLKTTGEYDLDIVVHDDWDGRPVSDEILKQGSDESSFFTSSVHLQQWEVRDTRHVPTGKEMQSEFAKKLGNKEQVEKSLEDFQGKAEAKIEALREQFENELRVNAEDTPKGISARKNMTALTAIEARWNDLTKPVLNEITESAGNVIELVNKETGEVFKGALVDVRLPDIKKKLRISPSAFRFKFLVHSPGGTIYVNGVDLHQGNKYRLESTYNESFDDLEGGLPDARYVRHFVTGNPIAAYDATGQKGRMVRFKSQDGQTVTGLMMAQNWTPANLANDPRFELVNGKAVAHFLKTGPVDYRTGSGTPVESEVARIFKREHYGQTVYKLAVPASKRTGGEIYLNDRLRKLLGDFTKIGNRMSVDIPEDRLGKVVDILMDVTKRPFKAVSFGAEVTAMQDRVKASNQAGQGRGSKSGELLQSVRSGATPGIVTSNAIITPPSVSGEIFQSLTAYHGTPHKVDRFRTDRIGTGEGAQVYGWGLYMAENPLVAKQYAEDLSARNFAYPTMEQLREYFKPGNIVKSYGGQHDRVLRFHESTPGRSGWSVEVEGVRKNSDGTWETIGGVRHHMTSPDAKDLKAAGIAGTEGNQYTVSLDVEPDELLDWDKPLSEQSKKVQEALLPIVEEARDAKKSRQGWSPGDAVGEQIYKLIGNHLWQSDETETINESNRAKKASVKMQGLGIPGIRYLDQGSRGQVRVAYSYKTREFVVSTDGRDTEVFPAGSDRDAAQAKAETRANELRESKTYNYVIFDEYKIRITHENGKELKPSEVLDSQIGKIVRKPTSKTIGIDRSVAERVTKLVTAKLGGQPIKLPSQVEAEGMTSRTLDTTEGYVWEGVSHVIPENIGLQEGETPEQAVLRVALHEKLGHEGVEIMLRDPKFKAQFDEIVGLVPDKVIQALPPSYLAQFPDWKTNLSHRRTLVKEHIAFEAQEKGKQDFKREPWHVRLWNAIKAWLRRMFPNVFMKGGKPEPITDDWVDGILQASREMLKRGGEDESETLEAKREEEPKYVEDVQERLSELQTTADKQEASWRKAEPLGNYRTYMSLKGKWQATLKQMSDLKRIIDPKWGDNLPHRPTDMLESKREDEEPPKIVYNVKEGLVRAKVKDTEGKVLHTTDYLKTKEEAKGKAQEFIGGTKPPEPPKAPATPAESLEPESFSAELTQPKKQSGIRQALDIFQQKTFPKLVHASEEAGDHAARMIAAREAAPLRAKIFADAVRASGVDENSFGTAVVEGQLRGIRDKFLEDAQKAEDDGDADLAQDLRDNAEEVTSLVGTPNSPFQEEEDYRAFLETPEAKKAVQIWHNRWGNEVEPIYKTLQDIDADEELPGRDPLTGLRSNLLAVRKNEKPQGRIVSAKAGNVQNVARRKSPFARKAYGNAEAYEIGLEPMLENTFGRQMEQYHKRKMEDALVASGNAKVGRPGQSPIINGEPTVALPLTRMTIVRTKGKETTSQQVSKTLYVPKSLATELRTALNLDAPADYPRLAAFGKFFNRAALAGWTEGMWHSVNLVVGSMSTPSATGNLALDALLKFAGRADTLVIGAKAVRNALKSSAENLLPIVEIAAGRRNYGGLLAKLTLDPLDHGVRLTYGQIYDELARRKIVSGKESEKRDFINSAAGQYNPRMRGKVYRTIKEIGVSPFITAGQTQANLAWRNLFFDPRVKGRTVYQKAMLHVNMLANLVGVFVLASVLTWLFTQKESPEDVPAGAIYWGKRDALGRPIYFDAARWFGVRRLQSATGTGALVRGIKNKLPAGMIAGQMVNDIVNAQITPLMGPVMQAGSKALTGKPPRLDARQEYPKGKPGTFNQGNWTKRALIEANPATRLANDIVTGKPHDEILAQQFTPFETMAGKKYETPAENLAGKYLGERGYTSTQEQRDKSQLKRQIVDMMRIGNPEGKKLLEKSYREKKINGADHDAVKKEGEMSLLESRLNRLTPEESLAVYKIASPQEQAKIKRLIQDKIGRSHLEEPEKRMDTKELIDAATR